MQKKYPYLIIIAIAIASRLLMPNLLLDDAYISLKVSKNLAEHGEMVFNSGEKVYSITNPAWTMILAALRLTGVDVVKCAWLAGLLCEILIGMALIKFSEKVLQSPWYGLFAATVFLTNPIFTITSIGGMEIALSMLTIIMAFDSLARGKAGMALVFASYAVWVRVDNLILLSIVFLWIVGKRMISKNYKILIAPSIILLVYLALGWIYFGSPFPISVFRKAAFVTNTGWFMGTLIIAREFIFTLFGRCTAYGLNGSILFAMIPFAIYGIFIVILNKRKELFPLLSFSAIYFLIYSLTGNTYAVLFPWYFLPPAAGILIAAVVGIKNLLDKIKLNPKTAISLIVAISLAWSSITIVSNNEKLKRFVDTIFLTREKTYAAASVWLSLYLPQNSIICTPEIGAVGFFCRPDLKILDMVGLTRPLSDTRKPVQLVKEENVEAIIYWLLPGQTFDQIAQVYPKYQWGEIGEVMIGIRKDLAPKIMEKSWQIPQIIKSIDISHEFDWKNHQQQTNSTKTES